MSNPQPIPATKERFAAKQLFNFIEAYTSVRSKVKTNFRDTGAFEDVAEIRQKKLPGVFVSSSGIDVILSVERPLLPFCPLPPDEIFKWVREGWKDPKLPTPSHHVSLLEDLSPEELLSLPEDQRLDEEGNPRQKEIFFEDDPSRLTIWESWVQKRNNWLIQYRRLYAANALYNRLYEWKSTLDKEGFQKGCFLCNGFVRSADGTINYPILLQQVFLEIDTTPSQPVIQVRVPDDVVTRISSDVLRQTKDDFNFEALGVLGKTIEETGIDLLDTQRIRDTMALLASNLSSKCAWHDQFDANFFNEATSYIFFPQPLIYLTDLPNGVKDAVEKIKGLIDNNEPIPLPLKHLLCGYEYGERVDIPSNPEEETPVGRIATVGGESKDVLLALPANRDQLDIARKVSYADAVLVQGPPGTGKTHTIANLLGNMLANGERVLVTSATDKALSVLRDKLPEVIQPLCVTLLDTKAGSSAEDLKRAVEGICATIEQRDYDSASLCKRDKIQAKERKQLMTRLTEVRQKLFAVRQDECNKIAFQGEARTLSEWAQWLRDNQNFKDTLPDTVSLESVTLSTEELQALYRTNVELCKADEIALQGWLPHSNELPTPEAVREWQLDQTEFNTSVTQSPVRSEKLRHVIRFDINGETLEVPHASIKNFKFDEAAVIAECPAWLRTAQIDGMLIEDAGHTSWDSLLQQAKNFITTATARRRDTQRPEVTISAEINWESLRTAASWFLENAPNGKVSFLQKMLGGDKVKQYQATIKQVLIGGQAPMSADAFKAILSEIDWQKCRNDMACVWDSQIGAAEGPLFLSLGKRPEVEMPKFLKLLEEALLWWTAHGQPILQQVEKLGIDASQLFKENDTSPNEAWRDAVWRETQSILIPISRYLAILQTQESLENQRNALISALTPPEGETPAPLVYLLQSSVINDADEYSLQLQDLIRLEGLRAVADQRKQLLEKLAKSAPTWAESIRSRKEGWTQAFVPNEVFTAMRWQSIFEMVRSYNDLDYKTLQHESHRLSREFRRVSAELAATRSWLHLARRLEHQPNLLQSLRGWMTTVQKIGKGTGKKAPRLQAQARQQAKACQSAIPVWVMTTQRALTTLDPREKFDVIIVDEASQSDMTALAVLFMGQRIVVVGDDQQVSPMGIGIKDEQIANMQREYLGNIPNASIYDENASLYDIIKTVSSPVMLREHFRCASEIIGFSNWLSYDGKIVPLRDMSKCPLRPHLVPYRVQGRRTPQDTNPTEAQAIVALIRSCIEQPEYDGKTFGVISMFSGKGQSQVELIDRMLKEAISPKEYEKRRLTVGISANFQGDERDVIFLSLIQNRSDPEKLMRKEGFGVGNSTKKRYNVAVSRARDQLWVIHSFDPDADLHSDDIRRRLLMHVRNPNNSDMQHDAVIARAESPFEKDVASRLIARGYKLEPQHSVGCYRLDFVVHDGDRAVALECDGERYHYTAEKIAEDMERQAILERSGWVFVRIRGSEYYRNPEVAIDRICSELSEHGINPNYGHTQESSDNSELLDRVKMRASEILQSEYILDVQTQLDDDIYADKDNEQIEVYLTSPAKFLEKHSETLDSQDTIHETLINNQATESQFSSESAQINTETNASDISSDRILETKSTTEPGITSKKQSEVATDTTESVELSTSQKTTEHSSQDTIHKTLVNNQDTRSQVSPINTETNASSVIADQFFEAQSLTESEITSENQHESEVATAATAPGTLPSPQKMTEHSEISEQTTDTQLSTYNDYRWNELTPDQQKRILEEDRYMFDYFEKHGWSVYDNRFAPTGSLWVVADREEFEPAQKHLYEKFGLYFKYTSKPGRTRGGMPGWWLANHTQNRGKK